MPTTIVRFEVNAQIAWRVLRDRKTSNWIGVCDALKLTARGDTWEELTRSVEEIQGELFRDLFEEGALDRFLLDLGWTPLMPLPARDAAPSLRFDIPTKMIREMAHATA